MSIKGALQTTRENNYGFTSIKVSGVWYGADKRGFKPDATEGDIVEFDSFDKPGKDGKTYPTYKCPSFRKVAAAAAPAPAVAGSRPVPAGKSDYALKEQYWANKEIEDKGKDTRISYFAACERAISFVDLAIRVGAFPAFEKAKPAAKLDVLAAFVGETTQRLVGEAYAQGKPEAPKVEAKAAEATEAATEESEESESEVWT